MLNWIILWKSLSGTFCLPSPTTNTKFSDPPIFKTIGWTWKSKNGKEIWHSHSHATFIEYKYICRCVCENYTNNFVLGWYLPRYVSIHKNAHLSHRNVSQNLTALIFLTNVKRLWLFRSVCLFSQKPPGSTTQVGRQLSWYFTSPLKFKFSSNLSQIEFRSLPIQEIQRWKISWPPVCLQECFVQNI